MPYMVQGRNKSKTKLPSPLKQNQMIHAIKRCQDATHQEYTEVKMPFCLMVNQTYVTIIY